MEPVIITIPQFHTVRTLGIKMSKDDLFHVHVTGIVATCIGDGWLDHANLQSKRPRNDAESVEDVCAKLGYCSHLWSPHSLSLVA